MTKVTNELLYEVLKTVQGDISVLKESVRRIDARIASMDHHLAGFYSEQRWQNDEIDNLRGRVEAIEDQDRDPKK
jgi:hypothetical protein